MLWDLPNSHVSVDDPSFTLFDQEKTNDVTKEKQSGSQCVFPTPRPLLL